MNDCSESDDDTEDNHRQLFSCFPDLLHELTGSMNDDDADIPSDNRVISLPRGKRCPA